MGVQDGIEVETKAGELTRDPLSQDSPGGRSGNDEEVELLSRLGW